jgi:polynucleotide 5'-kinase involved in rRNA processing
MGEIVQEPLHLFRPSDKHQRLEIVPETMEKLKAIQGPIVVITVVGTQRGGKSTLLNLLHSRRTSGFGLGE